MSMIETANSLLAMAAGNASRAHAREAVRASVVIVEPDGTECLMTFRVYQVAGGPFPMYYAVQRDLGTSGTYATPNRGIVEIAERNGCAVKTIQTEAVA